MHIAKYYIKDYNGIMASKKLVYTSGAKINCLAIMTLIQ